MKTLFISLVLLISLNSSIAQTNKFFYFDSGHNQITEEAFNAKLESHEFLEIPGKNENEKQLVARENHGIIVNTDKIYDLLQEHTDEEISRKKPLVILFYPGKDDNNSGGANDKLSLRIWRNKLWKGLDDIAGVKPIYIYKDKNGLKKYRKIITWYPDPESFFENNFFQHHYPGYSFVVISPEGEYISYFGEFPKEFVWEATKQLIPIK
ncbi:hypothetical protein [uncultured Draconibacterium sp.]|uniref:hypothetical protein n=1 Tax=uncultured Draconibacterium sp. TaxID=1573823 RepID=UPI002AA7879C|nr:hypothetical protein [uncultured Draconibacterium sp.]